MLINRWKEILVGGVIKHPYMNNPKVIFWLSLSLTFSAIYSYLALREGFSNPYIVQDDARQHVFWMERFVDAELFPQDLIADYFQSVAPLGYASLYRIAAKVGINPFIFNKILPSILGAIATYYCFRISLAIFPIPTAAFIAATILNQSLWMKDDLISATPRGFVYWIDCAVYLYQTTCCISIMPAEIYS